MVIFFVTVTSHHPSTNWAWCRMDNCCMFLCTVCSTFCACVLCQWMSLSVLDFVCRLPWYLCLGYFWIIVEGGSWYPSCAECLNSLLLFPGGLRQLYCGLGLCPAINKWLVLSAMIFTKQQD